MSLPAISRIKINDLWARAAEQLPDDVKRNINFSRPDHLNILAELHRDIESSKQEAINSRWKFTRKSGETVILRDVFEKIVRWIDVFKQGGDIVIQYDPAHAALPWAGIRFILQIAVNEPNKLATVVEGLERIAELICRYSIIEGLYLQHTSDTTEELERALIKLYAEVLAFLSDAKQYLEQGTGKRVLKSVVSAEMQFKPHLDATCKAEDDVSRCMALVDRYDKVRENAELKRLLAEIGAPLKRMNDDLKNIRDGLEATKRAEIMRWLSSEPYIQHHAQAKVGVLPGTGQWLLSDPLFKRWKNESASSILWLHGIPGSGKSKLVSIVIEDAVEGFRAGFNAHPIFFYCSGNTAEPSRSDPKSILASLARQLSSLAPGKPLLQPAMELYRKNEAEGFASGLLQMDESCNLITQLIQQHHETTIVIDAMDECDPSKRLGLLKALEQILRDSSSLVKIFVSSRNDHDIVLRLNNYPNLQIESSRNSNDIERFVEYQTQQLIQDGELLYYSTSQEEMKKLIIERVVKGSTGMFRWASMQLQFLSSFTFDADIKKSLGRLPPDLNTLYAEMYQILSTKSGAVQAIMFKHILNWLLCAQRRLKANELLAALSIAVQARDPEGRRSVPISKDMVLKVCNNFVIFDSQLDTFRFAHLSVREFLEQRVEFDSRETHALAAELCLWTTISVNSQNDTRKFLAKHGWSTNTAVSAIEEFCNYSDIFWMVHCEMADTRRYSGQLEAIFRHFLSGGLVDTSNSNSTTLSLPFQFWTSRVDDYGIRDLPLYHPLSWSLLTRCNLRPSWMPSLRLSLLLCYYCHFQEVIDGIAQEGTISRTDLLYYGVEYGNWQTIRVLFKRYGDDIEITQGIMVSAMGRGWDGPKFMRLLLNHGKDLLITSDVVGAAYCNRRYGDAIMKALLSWQSAGVSVTDRAVVEITKHFGKEILAALLDCQNVEILITEELLLSTIYNPESNEILALLLTCQGLDTAITEHVLIGIALNGSEEMMTLLLSSQEAHARISWRVLEHVLQEGARKEMIALLLDRRPEHFVITEEMVIEVLYTFQELEVFKVFLERGRAPVTKEVVRRAAAIHDPNAEILNVILDQGTENLITEALIQFTRRSMCGKKVPLLLDRKGANHKITEEVLVAAAGNRGCGIGTLTLLLDQKRPVVQISAKVVQAALRRRMGAIEAMRVFLDRATSDMVINGEVVLATLDHRQESRALLQLLLDRQDAGLEFSTYLDQPMRLYRYAMSQPPAPNQSSDVQIGRAMMTLRIHIQVAMLDVR